MKYRYILDPLFVSCLAIYAVNRWLIKPNCSGTFFHSYLNDLICVPFWIPITLWLMRKVHLRRDDAFPQAHEILLPMVVWPWLFEVFLPQTRLFRGVAIADANDILCYVLGTLLASVYWNVGRSWSGGWMVSRG